MKNNPAISGGYKSILINIFSLFNKFYHKLRLNTISGSKKNIVEHYDLGNNFYSLFLDETMAYSSGIYRNGNESLKESQLNKYENICKMLHLNESHHVLEIGSGWGGFSLYAIRNFNCKITTVTISNEQYNYVKELIQREN